MAVCIVGMHKMLGEAAAQAFGQAEIEVIGAGPEVGGPCPAALKDLEARLQSSPRISHIIYCGADFDPDRCEREPDNPRYLSADLPPLLAAMASRLSARLISVGTHHVFSGTLYSRGYAESRACHPVNTLGACQLEGERAVLAAHPSAIVLRTGWLYGDEEFGPFANLIRGIIRASLKGTELFIINDEVACPSLVSNLAQVIVQITSRDLESDVVFNLDPDPDPYASLDPDPESYVSGNNTHSLPLKGGIYHYNDDGQASWAFFASENARLALKYHHIERQVYLRHVSADAYPDRAERPTCCRFTCSKLRAHLSIPPYDWQEQLESFYGTASCSHLFNRLHGHLRPQAA